MPFVFHKASTYNEFSLDREPLSVRLSEPMSIDLRKVLKDLYTQKERLEHVITSLEALQQGSEAQMPPQKKTNRGRKSMGAEERREVSERMRRYWAARRKSKTQVAS
jgi:hypothetical protein